LLTNGWDRHERERPAQEFGLNFEEMNEQHHLTFDTYEQGKLSLDDYLNRVVFFKDRKFSKRGNKRIWAESASRQKEILVNKIV
jgi:putative hydrolase of the HAD superfamily